jgi:glutamine---fructose-6-phosphate transaminase (isomerizing)
MCGIVGYLGVRSPARVILDSLDTLEYRGYDSAGMALMTQEGQPVEVFKAPGKLLNLRALISQDLLNQNGPALKAGIGHIRWATHGAPTQVNAHPHQGKTGRVTLVHNGIIENYSALKEQLLAQGVVFLSETDTECIAHLLEVALADTPDFLQALLSVTRQLQGAFALSVMDANDPLKLYAVRKQAPLVVGRRLDPVQPEFIIASDTVAMANVANEVLYLSDGELVVIDASQVRRFTLDGTEQPALFQPLISSALTIDKKGFKHFMLKEIHEQPDVLRNGLMGRLVGVEAPIALENDCLFKTVSSVQDVMPLLSSVARLVVIGCGTSYNAALVGKYFIEEVAGMPVEVEAAGEFRYRKPVLGPDTLLVAISQSGETADTLEAVRLAKGLGVRTLAVTNRTDSSLAREVEATLAVRAGVEVSVCATKSFVAQVLVLMLIGLAIAESRNAMPHNEIVALKQELLALPTRLESYLGDVADVAQLAKAYGHVKHMLFIGRGVLYPVALEGALKLKEISYIHAEGYSGAELKHGPIALLDAEMPVVAVLSPGRLFDKVLTNCQEAKARDAQLIGITSHQDDKRLAGVFNHVLPMPASDERLAPLVSVVPLQLLAYYMAEHLGKDVDQPRNLAKSVTVE